MIASQLGKNLSAAWLLACTHAPPDKEHIRSIPLQSKLNHSIVLYILNKLFKTIIINNIIFVNFFIKII